MCSSGIAMFLAVISSLMKKWMFSIKSKFVEEHEVVLENSDDKFTR
jgi:hypothetical protein